MYKRKGCKFYAPLAKGDSPQCGEMSRSDRGDGRPLGGSGIATGGLRQRRWKIPPSARKLASTSLYKGGKKVVISHLSVNKGRCFFLQKNVKNGKKGAIY